MTSAQVIWAALIGAQVIIGAPFLLHLLPSQRTKTMAVLAAFQPAIDQLNASAATIAETIAAAKAGAASEQDLADTQAAVQAAADAVKTAAAQPVA